jgi:hypothetical protein
MTKSIVKHITCCVSCNAAFIINIDGDSTTCDLCLAENEIAYEEIDKNLLIDINRNNIFED